MRRLLYTGLLLAANGAFAGAVDPGLLTGDMGKLVVEEARAVPEAFRFIIERLLARDPARRYADHAELLTELDGVARAEEAAAHG